MNEDILELYRIDQTLQNSNYKKEDFIKALSDIYERFEGYFGIKTEMEEWLIDENGEQIKKTFREMENFYYKINLEIYQMLIKKEYKRIFSINKIELEVEYEKGRKYGYKAGLLDAQSKIGELL